MDLVTQNVPTNRPNMHSNWQGVVVDTICTVPQNEPLINLSYISSSFYPKPHPLPPKIYLEYTEKIIINLQLVWWDQPEN
jgi:hypothetical protein